MLWNELKRKRYAEDLAYRQRRRASNAASRRKYRVWTFPEGILRARRSTGRRLRDLQEDKAAVRRPLPFDRQGARPALSHVQFCDRVLGDSPAMVRRALKYLKTAGRDAGGRRRERRVIRTGSRTKKPARRGAGRRCSSAGRYQRVAKPGLRRCRDWAMQSPPKIISHNELQACAARRDVANAAPASGRSQASQTRRPLRSEATCLPKVRKHSSLGSRGRFRSCALGTGVKTGARFGLPR